MNEVIKGLKELDPCHLFFILIVLVVVLDVVYKIVLAAMRARDGKNKEKE